MSLDMLHTVPHVKQTKKYKKYRHLPEKLAESDPWEVLCVDLIRPYAIRRAGQSPSRKGENP